MAADIAQHIWLAVVGIYIVLSVITFFMYRADKLASRAGGWRKPEGTLILLGLLGGWPGAIVAQQLLRHKTRKVSFQAKFWLSVAVNIAVLIWLGWVGGVF